MEKKIQDYNVWYSFLFHYVSFVLKLSYSKILLVGKEKLPKDGAIIFAPNHTNTLMDAMVVLTMNRTPKVFVARADIFKNRKLSKIMTFLKIMPIMRQRDGYNAVKKNQATIDKAVDVLKDKVPFCIFPEGTHLAKFSSLPLSKGIFRIAFQAHEQMPQVPLYIVPIGIRYGHLFRFRSSVRMQLGKSINVGEFLKEHAHMTVQEQMNGLKDLLTERLHTIIFRIPNDEDYEAVYEICNVVEPLEIEKIQRKSNGKLHTLEKKFQANNQTLKRIEKLKESNPVEFYKILELAKQASRLRKKKGIYIESLTVKNPLSSRVTRMLLTFISLPYALPVSILACPVALVCRYVFTLLKDPAFKNSVRFLINLILWPLFVISYSLLAFSSLSWQWAFLVTLFIMPSPYVAHELYKSIRLIVSDIRLLKEKNLQKTYASLRDFIIDK